MDPDKIGKFIYELRKEKNLSQYQLADMVPISRQGVSKWERGKTIPDTQTLVVLSKIFDVSINELLNGERDPKNTIEQTTLSILDQSIKKTQLIKKITIASITIIAILLLAFLSYYFINSYNSIQVYKIGNTSDNFTTTDGIFITTREKYYLKLGKLKNKIDANINNISLYYKNGNKKIILVEDKEADNIVISDTTGYGEKFTHEDIKKIKDNLYLEITYNDNETAKIKLRSTRKYGNSSLFFLNQQKGEVTVVVTKEEKESSPIKEDKPKEETQATIKEISKDNKTQNKRIPEIKPKQEIQKEENKSEEAKKENLIQEEAPQETTPPEQEPEPEITPEQIVNKIKETCTPDLDSYVCEFSNIIIFYSNTENQIIIMNGDDIIDDYQISINQHMCANGDCAKEFNNIIKTHLFS